MSSGSLSNFKRIEPIKREENTPLLASPSDATFWGPRITAQGDWNMEREEDFCKNQYWAGRSITCVSNMHILQLEIKLTLFFSILAQISSVRVSTVILFT